MDGSEGLGIKLQVQSPVWGLKYSTVDRHAAIRGQRALS